MWKEKYFKFYYEIYKIKFVLCIIIDFWLYDCMLEFIVVILINYRDFVFIVF